MKKEESMMKDIGFQIYSVTQYFNSAALNLFLERYREKGIMITGFNICESLKGKIPNDVINNMKEFEKCYAYYGDSFLMGKNTCYLSVKSWPNGITMWDAKLNVNDKIKLADLAFCIEAFSTNNQMLFASIYTREEFNRKHMVTTESLISFPGVYIEDFEQFLPGVYRYTLFGKEVVKALGRERLMRLDHVTYTSVANDSVGLYVEKGIDDVNLDNLLNMEREIVRQIGENHFFDKNKKREYENGTIRSVPK